MDGTYALPEEARWSTIKNETGSWRGALFVAGYTTIVACVAWLTSALIYQIGRLLIA